MKMSAQLQHYQCSLPLRICIDGSVCLLKATVQLCACVCLYVHSIHSKLRFQMYLWSRWCSRYAPYICVDRLLHAYGSVAICSAQSVFLMLRSGPIYLLYTRYCCRNYFRATAYARLCSRLELIVWQLCVVPRTQAICAWPRPIWPDWMRIALECHMAAHQPGALPPTKGASW